MRCPFWPIWIIVFASLFAACGFDSVSSSQIKIIGGRDVVEGDPGFRSAVGLTYKAGDFQNFFCSGVLVAPRVILTAGHCTEKVTADRISVHFSEAVYPVERETVRQVSSMVSAGANSFPQNDIGLLFLNSDAPASAEVIPLIYNLPTPSKGSPLHLVAYGPRSDATWNKTGKKSIVDSVFNRVLTSEEVAGAATFGRTPGKGSSPGDSGGPVFVQSPQGWAVIGVISGADLWDCKDTSTESGCGTFTLVAHHQEWLQSHLKVETSPIYLSNWLD